MRIAIVGATGLVGREILAVLNEQNHPADDLILVASDASRGKEVMYAGRTLVVIGHDQAIETKPRVAIFSAGATTSREWAPKYAEAGITVIDNSSAWRMKPEIPLIVPEINAGILTKNDRIIANPNCSTIQMVVALAPLHRRYRIVRVVVSTYQSVTGTGAKALRQLENERKGIQGEMAYPHPIDLNLIPHGGDFLPEGDTAEEVKLLNETRKILNDSTISVTATVVRVPVIGGHSEAVNVELGEDFDLQEVKQLLSATEGVVLRDDSANNVYPMPLFARGKNEVFVGRIRRDTTRPHALNLFIVSDNLRKGAATNAVQIVNYIERSL